MSSYTDFFLNSPARVVQLDLLEISHPNFSKTYRIVRNKVGGCTATIDGTPQVFDYYPLSVTPNSDRGDLDYSLQIQLGDLGDVIPTELDNVVAADGMGTKPTVRYWTFRSDDLTAALFGPISLEITTIQMTREGTSFLASAPALNSNRTGEIYLPSRFPGLAGLL
jgi:hypothetical protein